jgi:hypothetical protein
VKVLDIVVTCVAQGAATNRPALIPKPRLGHVNRWRLPVPASIMTVAQEEAVRRNTGVLTGKRDPGCDRFADVAVARRQGDSLNDLNVFRWTRHVADDHNDRNQAGLEIHRQDELQ